jgi:hypothetical protein
MKAAYSQEVDDWLVTNPGKAVSQRHVSGLFHAAYNRTGTIEKAENAFAATGVYPYRPNIISDEDLNHLRLVDEMRCLIRI